MMASEPLVRKWCVDARNRGDISTFLPSARAGGASNPRGRPGRQLRFCYSFGDSFASPGGDVVPDDSRQKASISRTVPVMA